MSTWVLNDDENESPLSTSVLSGRPPTPLEKVADAKANLDGLDAQRRHYRKQYIKAIREALEFYSQREIAAHVGVTQKAISKLVRRQ